MAKFLDKTLMQSCAISSVIIASILIVIKSYILFDTKSFSIEASLLDSILDVFASIINLVAIKKALQPPTRQYQFGFGKAEALAGLFQSIIIIASGCWLLSQQIVHFGTPNDVQITFTSFVLMCFAATLTISLILWQRFVLNRVKSLAIKADSMHFETDLYMDFGVLLNFLILHFMDIKFFDLLFGVSAVLFIIYKTYPILKQSFDILMDKELDDKTRKNIIDIVYKNKNIKNIHQLRTRSSGQYEIIQFHIVLDPYLTLYQAHEITDSIEKDVVKAFPKAHVIVHQDPHQDEPDIDNLDPIHK